LNSNTTKQQKTITFPQKRRVCKERRGRKQVAGWKFKKGADNMKEGCKGRKRICRLNKEENQ